MRKKSGFTLAEVLITLGIIGVVAAMTIPTLMNNTNQLEFKVGFKKALSVLNQAVTMSKAVDSIDFSDATASTTISPSVYSIINSKMNVISTSTTSIANFTNFTATGNYTLFFNDGMAITFAQTDGSCTAASTCKMLIDVNGEKKPNALSLATAANTTAGVKDQFVVDIYDSQVVPHDEKAKYIMYNN